MRRTAALLLPLLAACIAVPVSVPARPAPPSGVVADGAPSDAGLARVAELVNAHRRRVGCPELRWSAAAARAAQGHSDDMARGGFFTHRGSNGSDVGSRLRAAGFEWRAVAENIAHTSAGPDDAVRLWLNSAGHRANIEGCRYTHHGVGMRGGRWTHVFGTPL